MKRALLLVLLGVIGFGLVVFLYVSAISLGVVVAHWKNSKLPTIDYAVPIGRALLVDECNPTKKTNVCRVWFTTGQYLYLDMNDQPKIEAKNLIGKLYTTQGNEQTTYNCNFSTGLCVVESVCYNETASGCWNTDYEKGNIDLRHDND